AEAVEEIPRGMAGRGRGKESELSGGLRVPGEAESRAAGFGLALEYRRRTLRRRSADAATHFNAALVMEQTSLLELASSEWQSAANSERNGEWRDEARKNLERIKERLSLRVAALEKVRHPEKLDLAALALPGPLEAAQQAAIEDWMARDARPEAALRLLAGEFERRHKDLWWRDFLGAPLPAEALRLLSESEWAYNSGRFADSERAGAAAEQAFERLGNSAGQLRARWRRIEASHRGDEPGRCPELLKGFAVEAEHRSWRWLLAEFWLDEITCRNLLYLGSSLRDRDRVLKQVEGMGFEGAALRALAFL